MRKVSAILLSGLLLLSLGGCSQATYNNVEQVFASEDEQRKSVGKMVDDFHQALYWGDASAATLYVVPEIRDDFHFQTSQRKEKERVIEAEVRKISLDQENDVANVDVFIKYFRVPNYVVKTRHEKQVWEYRSGEGRWLFKDSSVEQVL